jgi:L-cysteine:1D-myo-inositol 2-amino-2-deoxy-alpha-D-glucopyranoside ligase
MSAAQSMAMTGQKFSRAYVHAGMVGLNGQKMSKSLGNLVFVSRLISEGVEPVAIRWALMGHKYRDDLMWRAELIEVAQSEITRLRNI